ncbi:MAG: phosphoenolpyruvate--protein phosphotransferase [Hyphomicrobiales bacterium]
MAEPVTAQQRLDKIVTLIAANMVAEVCSIYVLRSAGDLELFATEGLKLEAVHRSRLKVGEGLVGTIAMTGEPLNLAEAQTHPSFKYLPETGEEIYSSFLGVPLLRSGQVIGVLVVQNRARRHYSEEEEEALQTTSMVLAEVIAAGELKELSQAVQADVSRVRSHHLKGETLADGIALGHVVLHEPRVVITNLIAESVPREKERLDEAIAVLRQQVDSLIGRLSLAEGGEHDEVLETFRMFAHDRGWARRIREAVETGLTAEAAVERVQGENRARMQRQADAYLRERMHDLDDLANRLLRILTGATGTAAKGQLPRDAIIVARTMGPAELLDYDRTRLRGLVLSEAGSVSHVAIVARALGVPAVGQVESILDLVDTGDPIIVDGGLGEIHVRPSAAIEQAYVEKVRFYARRQAKYQELRDRPAVTRDGERVRININAGLLVDLPHLVDAGADGIGLFRTELQFMLSPRFPRLDVQRKFYRSVLEAADGSPVVFRTLDIGSDKTLPYLAPMREDNPALGFRAIRFAMERPALMQLQVRALLMASGGHELNLMFPMVAEVEEFVRARQIVMQEKAALEAKGFPVPQTLRLGTMIEVPSLLWQLDHLLPQVDFLSIGSNDLIQYLFAADRGHPRLAGRYDSLSPPALNAIRAIVRKAKERSVPVTLCGEMAGKPLEAMALIGVGLRSVSMSPAAVGPVKSMVLALDAKKLEARMDELLDSPARTLRAELMAFAVDHNIPV